MYIRRNSDNTISEISVSYPIPGGEYITGAEVVRSPKGVLYLSSEQPPDPEPSLEEKLAAIEAKYAPKIAALREGIMSAYLTDGAIMDDNVSGLRTEWASVIAQRNAEMEALLI